MRHRMLLTAWIAVLGGCTTTGLRGPPLIRPRHRQPSHHMRTCRVAMIRAAAANQANRRLARWHIEQTPGWPAPEQMDDIFIIRKEWMMTGFKPRLWVVPAAGLCLLAGGCSQWMHAMVHKNSQTVAAITQAKPPGGREAKDPAVMILRPAIQAAAQAAGPMGGEALGIVAAIASLIAGATTTVAARKSQQLSQHRQAISELARAMAPGTILHPATQRVVTAATS